MCVCLIYMYVCLEGHDTRGFEVDLGGVSYMYIYIQKNMHMYKCMYIDIDMHVYICMFFWSRSKPTQRLIYHRPVVTRVTPPLLQSLRRSSSYAFDLAFIQNHPRELK